ncbi:hypothetical protein [Kitasatospora sp. NPDC001175]|uniref:hypothetical protein n=1 Tax=Kitasatospora sp. NPDC001175 TaxID=3157103 RepID=UPI003CFCC21C
MIRKRKAVGVSDGGPVVVEIEDVCGPATFERLPDALSALWGSLRLLPLGAVQADAFRYFLTRPQAADHVAEFIRRDGRIDLAFAMDGRSHYVRIRPADKAEPN